VSSAVKSSLLSSGLVLLFLATCFAQLATTSPGANPTALRVLILSGDGNHDWRESTPFLRRLLVDSGRFDVRVCESPLGISPQTLCPFDVVVDDCLGSALGTDTENALEAFVASGKGLVLTRGGLAFLNDSPGVKSSQTLASLIKASPARNPSESADSSFRLFAVKNVLPTHPVMAGLSNGVRTANEPLRGFDLQAGAEVLATSDKDEPLLFASVHGKGRVFCTTLGQNLAEMQEPAFLTTFLRGTEWAASGNVTLSTDIKMPGPSANGVRVLVITGGHDHEASFYGLFDGYKDIGWAPVTDTKLAFELHFPCDRWHHDGIAQTVRTRSISSRIARLSVG
jgi:hypothetical protein